jgi:hypothetical protein
MEKLFYTILFFAFFFHAEIGLKAQNNTRSERNFREFTRQIHLDFHTTEAISDIGSSFSKEQFQEALKAGHVNSINIFAKCHHSWFYYPTVTGKMHPGLDFDLMGAQIEACREIGVRVNVYFTVGWSANDAKEHPEWALLDKNDTNEYREQLKKLGPIKVGSTFNLLVTMPN